MKISQAEARRLKRRVAELEAVQSRQRNKWASDFPGGVCMGTLKRERDWLTGRLDGAAMLGHVNVVRVRDDGTFEFYSVK